MHRPVNRSAALALLLLAACSSEPDFDERFSNAEEQIRSKAREIDAELHKGTAETDQGHASPAGKDSTT